MQYGVIRGMHIWDLSKVINSFYELIIGPFTD